MSGTRTLYLRGMADALLREAKAEAARRGITLTAFVTEAIERAVADASGSASLPAELAADAEWFEENRQRLLETYPGEYVAIVDREVFDHDVDSGALAERVFTKLDRRHVFMPHCVEHEEPVHLRSPRVVR